MDKIIPELREKQVEQLAHYISHKKDMDLSDPGTGKTPPVCVYAFWNWTRNRKKTLWAMPKSLLRKNLKEMLRFTEFKEEDVVILDVDHAPMTKSWTGPTITRTKRVQAWNIEAQGVRTNTFLYKQELPSNARLIYQMDGAFWTFGGREPTDKRATDVIVKPILGPDGKPSKVISTNGRKKTPGVLIEEKARDMIAVQADAKVFICTFAFMAEHWQRLISTIPDISLLLGDEIHMPGGWSTPGTKSTDAMFFVNRHVDRFLVMTGTLINGRLDSAYPVLHAIEPRYFGSFEGFQLQYSAVIDDYGRTVVWKNEDHLRQIIERHSIRRTFEEVYGKEPVVFFTEFVEMAEEVQAEYDKFEQQALLELEDGRILDGTMPGVAAIRCRQIMGHPETLGLGDSEFTPKDERLRILLSEGKRTLVFASLKPEQERIRHLAESMGLRVALINSDVSGKNRAKIDEMAQANKLDVIVASGPTVAVGYNWENFDLVVFASVDYMDTNVLQAYRRASRGTRTTTLRVIFLRYVSEAEDKMYSILTSKSQLANRVDATRPVLEFREAA